MEIIIDLDFAKLGYVEIYVNKFNRRYRQGRTFKLTNRWKMVVPAFAARCRSDWCRSHFWCRAPNCRWSLPSRLHTGTEQS